MFGRERTEYESEYDVEGSLYEKATRKTRENPLVPVGCALTVAALVMGLRAMTHDDIRRSNLMMRYRVLAQGFTLTALIGGLLYSTASRARPAAPGADGPGPGSSP